MTSCSTFPENRALCSSWRRGRGRLKDAPFCPPTQDTLHTLLSAGQPARVVPTPRTAPTLFAYPQYFGGAFAFFFFFSPSSLLFFLPSDSFFPSHHHTPPLVSTFHYISFSPPLPLSSHHHHPAISLVFFLFISSRGVWKIAFLFFFPLVFPFTPVPPSLSSSLCVLKRWYRSSRPRFFTTFLKLSPLLSSISHLY